MILNVFDKFWHQFQHVFDVFWPPNDPQTVKNSQNHVVEWTPAAGTRGTYVPLSAPIFEVPLGK